MAKEVCFVEYNCLFVYVYVGGRRSREPFSHGFSLIQQIVDTATRRDSYWIHVYYIYIFIHQRMIEEKKEKREETINDYKQWSKRHKDTFRCSLSYAFHLIWIVVFEHLNLKWTFELSLCKQFHFIRNSRSLNVFTYTEWTKKLAAKFCHNSVRHWRLLKILSLTHSATNMQYSDD